MKLFYILDDDKNVIECDSVLEWSAFFNEQSRLVAYDEVGDFLVTTSFFGIVGKIFETLVAKKNMESMEIEDLYPYSTWQDAEAGHNKIVEKLRSNHEHDNNI